MSELQDLKNKVFTEPSTKSNRPYIIELIKLHVSTAKSLSDDELLNVEGDKIASDISGALAWNSADEGVQHDNWLNENDEPVLYDILDVSGMLDSDGNTKENWLKLFSLSEKIQ